MDRKEIKEAAALFNTVKTMVEEVETPVSFLNEAEEVITVEMDKMPRDKKGLEEWEKAAPVKVYEAVNAIESVKIGDGDVRAIDDSMLAEYLPELVKALYMEVKAAMVPKEEEKPAKGKKPKKEKAVKEKKEKPKKEKKDPAEKKEKEWRDGSLCQTIYLTAKNSETPITVKETVEIVIKTDVGKKSKNLKNQTTVVLNEAVERGLLKKVDDGFTKI